MLRILEINALSEMPLAVFIVMNQHEQFVFSWLCSNVIWECNEIS